MSGPGCEASWPRLLCDIHHYRVGATGGLIIAIGVPMCARVTWAAGGRSYRAEGVACVGEGGARPRGVPQIAREGLMAVSRYLSDKQD